MDILFAALLLVLAGGLAPLALHRWLSAAKVAHVSLVAAGCLTGLYGVPFIARITAKTYPDRNCVINFREQLLRFE